MSRRYYKGRLQMRFGVNWFFILLLFLLMHTPLFAHKINVFASPEGNRVSGYAYFRGGSRAVNSQVSVFFTDGTLFLTTQTSDDGCFFFDVTERAEYSIKVITPDGHAASYRLMPHEFSAALPLRDDATLTSDVTDELEAELVSVDCTEVALSSLVERAVRKEIRLLKEHLQLQEDRARLQDIVGGIGYIFGIFGIVMFFKAKR